jgi:hypothetical protein
LRGGSFRGATSDTREEKIAAQIECCRSVERHIVRPYVDAGTRVSVFLTLYDSDVRDASALRELQRPFDGRVAAVTTLASKWAEQLLSTVAAIDALLQHCKSHADVFDAVVVTRFDMRFKADLRPMLGADLRAMDGVRFLWHEHGSSWRHAWSPTSDTVASATEVQIKQWATLTAKMVRSRQRTFVGRGWRRDLRTSDTLHAFGYGYTRCFLGALRLELMRDWKLTERTTRARHSSLSEEALAPKLLAEFPSNHWLHKMAWHVFQALGVDVRTAEWQHNRTSYPTIGYLVRNGAFSSNPCGSSCFLNPVYDFYPRGKWVVDSGICQRDSDFILDPSTGTLCCPSPDYCCPNSAYNCSAPGAVLFNAATANGGQPVPEKEILGGWRRHFWSIERHSDSSSLCHAARNEWNGGSIRPACFWAMDDDSIDVVHRVWSNAPPAPRLHDDDDTHLWAKGHH